MKYLKLITIFFSALLIKYAISGTIDPAINDKKYIEYGEKFDYVVPLCGIYNDGTMFCASAVMINDNTILTAAHVLKNCDLCYITHNDKKFEIIDINIHDDFNIATGEYDIAIAYSKQGFNLQFYPDLYDNDDEMGKLCSIAGYGLTGDFLTGAIKYDGKKRAGLNKIDYALDVFLICSPSIIQDTDLEFCISKGDSGGGLFIDKKLAGINSSMIASKRIPKSQYGDESVHARVSKFIPWIRQKIKDHTKK